MSGYFVPRDYHWDYNAPVEEWPHELLADLTGMLQYIANKGSDTQRAILMAHCILLHEAITGKPSPARILPRQAKPKPRRATQ